MDATQGDPSVLQRLDALGLSYLISSLPSTSIYDPFLLAGAGPARIEEVPEELADAGVDEVHARGNDQHGETRAGVHDRSTGATPRGTKVSGGLEFESHKKHSLFK